MIHLWSNERTMEENPGTGRGSVHLYHFLLAVSGLQLGNLGVSLEKVIY